MKVSSAILILLLAISCSAQTFKGRVINGSTGNPQPSSQVILLTSAGEQGRAMTNDSGEFRIIPKANLGRRASAIVEVTQDGVDYFQPVVQGQFATFKVYQSAGSVPLIGDQLSILQFQSVGERLQITELHALTNFSTPPITQVGLNNFVLSIPPGAKIEPATVSSPDGGTSKVPLTPVAGSTGQYRIEFPIKPGLTRYAIRYELPYDARELVFRRQAQYRMDRLGVIIPKSMHFRSLSPRSFRPVAGPKGAQEQQFELDKIASNFAIAFSLSGTGGLAHSFRPLQPGARSTSTQPAPQISAASRTAVSAGPTPITRRSLVISHQRVIAVGILVTAATLCWFYMRIFKSPIRDRVRSFATDVDLSLDSHEGSERGQGGGRDRYR